MTSKNNICKCTQRLFHDGHPQQQGPRHLLMPQAAYVDWPKIATASFHLTLLPSFPIATNETPNLKIRLIHLQRMSSIIASLYFAAVHSPFSLEPMNLLSFFQLLSLVLLYLLFFTSSFLCAFSAFPASIHTCFFGF